MDTFFVIFAPMEAQNLPSDLSNDQLIIVATRYLALLEKAKQLLPSADQSLLAGSAGTAYLKHKGHRALSEEDSENIIRSLGSEEDKAVLLQFEHTQQILSQRLKKNKWSSLIIEEAQIPYFSARRRIARPDLWKPEEIIQVVEVLKRRQL